MRILYVVLGTLVLSQAEAASVGPKLRSHDWEITAAMGGAPLGGIIGDAGPNAGVNVLTGGGSTLTTVAIGAGVGYLLASDWQVVLSPTLALATNDTVTNTLFGINGGVIYSFSGDSLRDSFFVTAMPGLVVLTSIGTTVNFQFVVGVGKRLELTESISYSPRVTYTGVTATPYLSNIGVTPLAFSLFL